jgi:hypothetical protein
MHVFEEKKNIRNIRYSRDGDLSFAEPPLIPFKVVVNNYKQQTESITEEKDEDDLIDETTSSEEYGLPPQPDSYLKYPKYDWF